MTRVHYATILLICNPPARLLPVSGCVQVYVESATMFF